MTLCSCGCGKPLTKRQSGRGLHNACYQRIRRAALRAGAWKTLPRPADRTCAEPGCASPHCAKGLCRAHYDRNRSKPA